MAHRWTALLFASVCLIGLPAHSDGPVVVAADAQNGGNGWRFDVTISHPDTGWDHYADGWGIYLEDGTELGFRTLAHPHVNEQPFTRSLSGVKIPAGTTTVIVRPRDSMETWGADHSVALN